MWRLAGSLEPTDSQTWVDTDGEHILINTVMTHQKARNVQRDARIAVGIVDPNNPLQSWAIRGNVLSATTEGAREHIDTLSHK